MPAEKHDLSSLAEKLSLTYQAAQDFKKAFDITEHIGIDNLAHPLVQIGKVQGSCDFNPTDAIKRLDWLAREPVHGRYHRHTIQLGIAEIYMAAGNFEAVNEVFNKVPNRILERRHYLSLAKSKGKRGHDSKPELARVLAGIEKSKESSNAIDGYIELAEAHYQSTGEYPGIYLSRAETNIKNYEKRWGGHSDEADLPGYHMNLSKAYAFCGNFDRALTHVDKVRGYTPITEAIDKMSALKAITQEQLKRNLYPEAAKSARQAIHIITQAKPRPKHLQQYLTHGQTIDVPKLLLLEAQAEVLMGEETAAAAIFDSVTERVSKIPLGGYWKNDVLLDKARVEYALNIDPAGTLNQALGELDNMPNDPNYDEFFDLIQQTFGYEGLAAAAVDLGHLDTAETVLGKFELFFDKGLDVYWQMAEVKAKIAAGKAKGGLSLKEIGELSPEEILAIDTSGNLLSGKAIYYFGLNKKIAAY